MIRSFQKYIIFKICSSIENYMLRAILDPLTYFYSIILSLLYFILNTCLRYFSLAWCSLIPKLLNYYEVNITMK